MQIIFPQYRFLDAIQQPITANRKSIDNKSDYRFHEYPHWGNYNLTFGATNVETLSKMQTVLKTKTYKYSDLYKLYGELTDAAKKNIRGQAKLFKIFDMTFKKWLPIAIMGNLSGKTPRTIDDNFIGILTKFAKYGLKTEDYYKVCIKHPTLFCSFPDTIENNVLGLVSRFEKEGLTTEDYIKACIKKLQLFTCSPDTIEKNVRKLVSKFEKEGLTTEDYIKACVKQPSLFSSFPETVEKNVRELVSRFKKEGLTTEDYLHACIKLPPLFCQSPDTIEEHIKAYMFSFKNNLGYEDPNIINKVLKRNLSFSTSLIYLQNIIKPQIIKQSKELSNLNDVGIKPTLKEYFASHPSKKFIIKVIDDEMTESFVKTMKEFCQKEYGRDDMFEFVIKL